MAPFFRLTTDAAGQIFQPVVTLNVLLSCSGSALWPVEAVRFYNADGFFSPPYSLCAKISKRLLKRHSFLSSQDYPVELTPDFFPNAQTLLFG